MVVDTTIFIEFLRATDRSKTTLASLSSDAVLFVSAVTVFELFSGASDEAKYADVHKLLNEVLVLPVNAEVGEKSGEIFRQLRSSGQMIEATDILIAATALIYDIPVLTLNKRHFERVQGLALVK